MIQINVIGIMLQCSTKKKKHIYIFIYGSVRLMLRPTGQSDKIQFIKSSQYIGSIGSIGYIGSIVHTGNIPPAK